MSLYTHCIWLEPREIRYFELSVKEILPFLRWTNFGIVRLTKKTKLSNLRRIYHEKVPSLCITKPTTDARVTSWEHPFFVDWQKQTFSMWFPSHPASVKRWTNKVVKWRNLKKLFYIPARTRDRTATNGFGLIWELETSQKRPYVTPFLFSMNRLLGGWKRGTRNVFFFKYYSTWATNWINS